MALGARSDVFTMVVRQTSRLVAGGLALGISSGFVLMRFLSSEICEVQSHAQVIFVSVSLVMAAVAAFACLIPTWRAAQVDPIIALHYE
jgi:putative ABC transport system permease protein